MTRVLRFTRVVRSHPCHHWHGSPRPFFLETTMPRRIDWLYFRKS